MENIKALVLMSGGLDSSLAVKLMLEQGISVIGVKFSSPFCTCDQQGRCFAKDTAIKLGIPFKIVSKGVDYLKIIRQPKHGYGSGMNPCIDCRIFMLKKAKEIAKEVGAKFIVTGEVLGQRPMSQHLSALKKIEKETNLEGKILRPLSAKHLPITEPEIKNWVDREKLLAITGRSRKVQFELAKNLGIDEYACPAGGCLLTVKQFANKICDLFKHKKQVTWNDVLLLKIGRHYRFDRSKIIVGRDELENKILLNRKQKADYVFEVLNHGSPITLLQGIKNNQSIKIAAGLTAKYADCRDQKVMVKYGATKPVKSIVVEALSQKEADKLNLTLKGDYKRE
jgi:tRNA U34 2-thiouridine synthase MnmA/TrmU